MLAAVTSVERRQVVDLPEPVPLVVEHRLVERECACCGTRNPGGGTARGGRPVQYGPRVEARRSPLSLWRGQFLARGPGRAAMAELFGTPLSAGTVAADARPRPRPAWPRSSSPRVRDEIAAAPVAGFDETGLRVAGKLHWVHCARTEKYTLLVCHLRRGGVEGMAYLGVLPGLHRGRGARLLVAV
ncbi:transposase [Pseudofrankia sp. DC12]|uniref:transposase n=1 Tax=Pseudofrankia sp. DC12 TaxID=683315 RepID=UPI000AC6A909|nr:transposase [Pseudofrankia sp. DC12]